MTADSSGFILGFDPGGQGKTGSKGNFGWSVCHANAEGLEKVELGLARNAVDALDQAARSIEGFDTTGSVSVLAAGIDAPMFWNPTGARKVDVLLRKALEDADFPRPEKTVQQINSLWGACLAQGLLLGKHLRDRWNLRITESHPKALEHLLTHAGHSEEKQVVERLMAGLEDPGRHKRDATLSAVTAWAMVRSLPGWRDIYVDEPNPLQPFGTPVSYWMPIPQQLLSVQTGRQLQATG